MTLILIEESIVKHRDSITFSVFISSAPNYEIQIVIPRQTLEKIVPSPTRSIDERFDVHRELFMDIVNRRWNAGALDRNGCITISGLDEIEQPKHSPPALVALQDGSDLPFERPDAKRVSIQQAATF
jgi:hypothetical protein